jgi:excisionase family DNA binding protein
MEHQARHLKRTLQSLKQALEAHYRSLEGLEIALIEFEEAIGGQQRRERPQQDEQEAQPREGSLELLSITDVCLELGMGKSWVYGRIKSGEIPSVKLGRNIKVRREDLEAYLEGQRYQGFGKPLLANGKGTQQSSARHLRSGQAPPPCTAASKTSSVLRDC